MRPRDIHLLAVSIVLFVAAFTALGERQLKRYLAEQRRRPYSFLAQHLNRHPAREWCDDQQARFRTYSTGVVDRFREEIAALWREREAIDVPKFGLLNLGPIQLRVNPKAPPGVGFDSSSWSWDEAYSLIRKTQINPQAKENSNLWRDVDSMVRFLLEKDYARLFLGRKFLAPELTLHQFRPSSAVWRSGPQEFTVQLDPGDFAGHENALGRMLEAEWQKPGWKLKVEWKSGGLYKMLAHRDSNRSFVNHKRHTMEIAHLAWTRTVAHELGHVLGFDDHYYNVWKNRNCYYSQESRLSDLMSNSERGGVTTRHWEILDEAYPWKGEAKKEPFSYVYGK